MLGTGYPNRYMSPKFGLDFHSLGRAWSDRASLFMIGDWAHPPAIALLLTRILRRAPVALWADTPQEHLHRPFPKRQLRRIFLRWLLRQVDATFGSGRPAARALRSMGAPDESIVDLQFMADTERPQRVRQDPKVIERAARLRESVGVDEDGVVFLMSGTIDFKKKAQDVGLRAFARMQARAPRKVGLLVAGAGPELPLLEQELARLGLESRVRLLGWQEPDDMDAAYQASDVLLHPAHYDPFPLVVIEAMIWGCPVIGTATSGSVEERVVNGESGFVVNPGDVEGMAAAMLRVVESPELLTRMRENARRAAEAWPIARGVEIIRQVLATSIAKRARKPDER